MEERLLLLETLTERRKSDGWHQFVPHPKQKEFIDAAMAWPPKNFVGMFAANRTGKSDAGAYVGAALARFGNQAARYVGGLGSAVEVKDTATSGWVVSLDFPSSRDIIQPKYFDNGYSPPGAHRPFIPQHEIERWDAQDQILKLKSGSLIGFKSAESGRLKFQGTGKDWIHFDEEPPKDVYSECTIRVEAGRRVRIFMTCTLLPPPGAVGGVTWVFNELVKDWKSGRAGISIFTASIYDNPHLDKQEIERLEAVYPEGSLERRIRLNGELLPTTAGARIAGNFERSLHVLPQEKFFFLRRPLCWLWDFNVEPMVTLIGQRDGRIFRYFDELYLEQGNINAMCDLFKRSYPTHLAEIRVYGDASGHQRSHQSNRSSYKLILTELMGYNVPVKVLTPDKNPSITDRVNAMNYALMDERREMNVEIDPRCVQFIDDLEQVVSDGKGGIRKTSNRRDPYFWRTHALDAGTYWIAQEAPVLGVAGKDYTKKPISVPRVRYG